MLCGQIQTMAIMAWPLSWKQRRRRESVWSIQNLSIGPTHGAEFREWLMSSAGFYTTIESLFFPCAHFVHTNPLEMLNPISAVIFFVISKSTQNGNIMRRKSKPFIFRFEVNFSKHLPCEQTHQPIMTVVNSQSSQSCSLFNPRLLTETIACHFVPEHFY